MSPRNAVAKRGSGVRIDGRERPNLKVSSSVTTNATDIRPIMIIPKIDPMIEPAIVTNLGLGPSEKSA